MATVTLRDHEADAFRREFKAWVARQPEDERPAAEPPMSESPGFVVFAWVPQPLADDLLERGVFVNMILSP